MGVEGKEKGAVRYGRVSKEFTTSLEGKGRVGRSVGWGPVARMKTR